MIRPRGSAANRRSVSTRSRSPRRSRGRRGFLGCGPRSPLPQALVRALIASLTADSRSKHLRALDALCASCRRRPARPPRRSPVPSHELPLLTKAIFGWTPPPPYVTCRLGRTGPSELVWPNGKPVHVLARAISARHAAKLLPPVTLRDSPIRRIASSVLQPSVESPVTSPRPGEPVASSALTSSSARCASLLLEPFAVLVRRHFVYAKPLECRIGGRNRCKMRSTSSRNTSRPTSYGGSSPRG